jgi:hypothetical protein
MKIAIGKVKTMRTIDPIVAKMVQKNKEKKIVYSLIFNQNQILKICTSLFIHKIQVSHDGVFVVLSYYVYVMLVNGNWFRKQRMH